MKISDGTPATVPLYWEKQGWIGYAGTYVCLQTWLNEARTNIGLSPTVGFLNENDSWLILQFLENCRQVCLLLWAFSRLQVFPHSKLAASGGKERHTLQHPNVLAGLRRPNIRRKIFWVSAQI